MAQKVQTLYVDDLDGSEADGTIRFGLDGAEYEIDLSARNATAFREQLAPYTERARKASQAPGSRAGRSASTRERSSGIRA
jgi:hypothetical protein